MGNCPQQAPHDTLSKAHPGLLLQLLPHASLPLLEPSCPEEYYKLTTEALKTPSKGAPELNCKLLLDRLEQEQQGLTRVTG